MNDSECKNSVIKRQAALNTVKEMFKACEGDLETYRDLMIACMLDLPEAQPEIIHCKDCKYHYPSFCKAWSKYGTIQTKASGFCFLAERKTE